MGQQAPTDPTFHAGFAVVAAASQSKSPFENADPTLDTGSPPVCPSKSAAAMRHGFPDAILQTVVRESVRLGEAFTYARTIVEHDPDGMGAVDYRAVAGELVERWGLLSPSREGEAATEGAR